MPRYRELAVPQPELQAAESGPRCPSSVRPATSRALAWLGAVCVAIVLAAAAKAAELPPTVLSGGIGEAEQAELAAREAQFDLKLVFSLVQGNYVTDVRVMIEGGGGTVIDHVSEGPILLARLPSGRYRVTAVYLDQPVRRVIRVASGRLRTEHFRWPADPVNDLPVSRWLNRE